MTDKYVMMSAVKRQITQKQFEAQQFLFAASVHSNPRLVDQYERAARDFEHESKVLEDVLALVEQHGPEIARRGDSVTP